MTHDNHDRRLEELLVRMVPALANKDELDAAAADERPVPPELRTRTLARAETFSSEALAAVILEAAKARGKDTEALIEASGAPTAEVRNFLDGRGDPRKVGSRGLARVLASAGVDATMLRDLLAQAVAQFVVVYPGQKRGRWPLRALSGQPRERPGRPKHDPAVGRAAGSAFADEVVEAWQQLTRGDS